jgi:hypothetical protein
MDTKDKAYWNRVHCRDTIFYLHARSSLGLRINPVMPVIAFLRTYRDT